MLDFIEYSIGEDLSDILIMISTLQDLFLHLLIYVFGEQVKRVDCVAIDLRIGINYQLLFLSFGLRDFTNLEYIEDVKLLTSINEHSHADRSS